MSALPPKADITEGYEKCPLMTQSGPRRALAAAGERRDQNDPSPLNMFQRTATITDDGGQARAVFGSNDHTNILCHNHRIAQPQKNVNPVFVSVH